MLYTQPTEVADTNVPAIVPEILEKWVKDALTPVHGYEFNVPARLKELDIEVPHLVSSKDQLALTTVAVEVPPVEPDVQSPLVPSEDTARTQKNQLMVFWLIWDEEKE